MPERQTNHNSPPRHPHQPPTQLLGVPPHQLLASGCFKSSFDTISMGVGRVFLPGWNRLEMAVPYGFNRFCSIPRSWVEKMGFVLKRWWFRALEAASKSK